MPNRGLTPDCDHCRWYRISKGEEYCELHKINLVNATDVFCSRYTNPGPKGLDWLDNELNRKELKQDMMYIWLAGWEVKFFYVPLASISEYATWTPWIFVNELEKLKDKYRGWTV